MEKYLSVEDVARILKLEKATIYAFTSSKEIPHFKVGGRILFSEEEIEKWVNSKTIAKSKENANGK